MDENVTKATYSNLECIDRKSRKELIAAAATVSLVWFSVGSRVITGRDIDKETSKRITVGILKLYFLSSLNKNIFK